MGSIFPTLRHIFSISLGPYRGSLLTSTSISLVSIKQGSVDMCSFVSLSSLVSLAARLLRLASLK